MTATANPIPSSAAAAATHQAAATATLPLLEARRLRDSLAALLHSEQAAMADFLVALAEFDRRRGWEPLGHANLFAFLRVELRLSRSAAFYRKSAAELLQDFPDVIEPLREGRLCLSTITELAKVLTEENRAVVVPRFFGLSAREAQELVAELQPREVPSTRTVVTRVADRSAPPPTSSAQPLLSLATATAFAPESVVTADTYPNVVPLSRVLTSELANGGGGRPTTRRDDVEPLTADLRRLHITVDALFLKMLDTARAGLSHSIPGASVEQALKAALELLLEKQARARGLVKKPRQVLATAIPNTATATTTTEPRHRRTGPRQQIPAATRRAVWVRDQGRCSWPLDSGGVCGSTHRLELDHLVPWARWGGETVDDLRIVCSAHNALAARRAFGERCVARYERRSPPRPAH